MLSALYKWYFELLRNLMIVGLLLHLGLQSNSNLLIGAGALGALLFSLHFASRINYFYFKPFHTMKGFILPGFLNFLFTLVIVLVVTLGITRMVANIAVGIAESYTTKNKVLQK